MNALRLFPVLSTALLVTLAAHSQETSYLDFSGNPTTRAQAAAVRTTTHSDSGWTVAEHWLNGRLKLTGTYADDSLKIRAGTFEYYDSSGRILLRCRFTANKESGPETHYYANGQVLLTGDVEDGKRQGDWNSYFQTGKLYATASFKDNEQVSASFYNEDGSPNPAAKIFFQESGYPGGPMAWLRFLNQNLRYPDQAVNNEIQGTVVIQFKVSPEGKASDFTIIQPANKFLDAEAMRVVKGSGDWLPAIYAGVPTETYKRQPIVFRLEVEPTPPKKHHRL